MSALAGYPAQPRLNPDVRPPSARNPSGDHNENTKEVMIQCPNCQARTRLTDNEFFGVGLAVNRFIRICDQCDWSALVSGAGPRLEADQPAARQWDRLRFALRRAWRSALGEGPRLH